MAANEPAGGDWQRAPSGTSDNLSYILRIGKALLLSFIRKLWQESVLHHPQRASVEQPGGEAIEQLVGEDVPDNAEVTTLRQCMFRIWQELSSDPEITSMVQTVNSDCPLQVLAEVSEHLFATRINWGRIVVFFYFAYRVIVQSAANWLPKVMDWAGTFLENSLASWILRQGGWTAMLSYIPFPR